MRTTRQRKAIQKVFEDASSPLTIEEVLEETSKFAQIGIATMYRNIKRLVEEGEIVAIEFSGEPTRYEKAGPCHHHHFQCKSCQKLFEVEGCDDVLNNMIPKGFLLEAHDIQLYGLCKTCNYKQVDP